MKDNSENKGLWVWLIPSWPEPVYSIPGSTAQNECDLPTTAIINLQGYSEICNFQATTTMCMISANKYVALANTTAVTF